MITFTVTENNGRDIRLEARVPVSSPYAPDREREARRQVDRALEAAADTFPPEWSRDLCDWSRIEWSDSEGHVVVRMPAAMGRHVLALQEREALQEAAS